MAWYEVLAILFGGGSCIYLLIDKLILSRKEQHEAREADAHADREQIGTGLEAIGFYREIDALIKAQTDPLNEKIDELTAKVGRWCCYRSCELRTRDEEAANEPPLTLSDLSEFLNGKHGKHAQD